MRTETKDNSVIIFLEGRIDTNNAPDIEKEIMEVLNSNEGATPVFDASKLAYISSAGLRVLMKVKRSVKDSIEILEVSPEVYDIFDTTGFTNLFDVKKKLREISVDGCEVIGEGGNGIVYRLDQETIAKVYYGDRNDLEKIRKNREVTKSVFVQGIPTAISFDVVRVGKNYGVMYEMIDAKSMLQVLGSHPDELEKYANMIADTLIKLHKIELEPGSLQDARNNARGDIQAVADRGYYTEDETKRLMKLIDDIPERNTFIHQDFHPGNIMYQNGEIVLIDVEDSGLGHPVLDLSSMYLVYVTAAEHGWGKIKGAIGPKEFARVWEIILSKYFNTTDKKDLAEINRVLLGYSQIKFIRGIATSPSVPNIIRKPVIKKTKKKLFSTIDTLYPIP
jgi:uncharacterized protein (TIGR02172 family)